MNFVASAVEKTGVDETPLAPARHARILEVNSGAGAPLIHNSDLERVLFAQRHPLPG